MNKQAVATPAPSGAAAKKPGDRTTRYQWFAEELEYRSDALKTRLEGSGISLDFFKQCALTALRETKDLLNATPTSVWSAIYKAADDACLPDGRDGKIVLRKNGDKLEASWQLMVGGIRKKVRRSKEVLKFTADTVHEKDHFVFAKGDQEFIEHRPYIGADRGKIIAAYAIARLSNGETVREVMSIHECHAIRDRFSDGWKAFKGNRIKDTPWHSSEGEMCKKTVARRLAKVLPMDTDVRASIEHDDDDVLPDADGQGQALPVPPKRPALSDFQQTGAAHAEDAGDEPSGDDDGHGETDGPVIDGEAQVVEEKPAADAAPAPAAQAQTGPVTPEMRFHNLKARLSKAPRAVQNEIWDAEIAPVTEDFTIGQISELSALLKDD